MGDLLQLPGNGFRWNRAQVEALAPRDDGREDLVGFGGGKDEFYMCGRLLQGLQEGIKGRRLEHVHFVNVVDLETSAGGSVVNRFSQFPDLIDPVI